MAELTQMITQSPPRRFMSLGKGHGTGSPTPHWTPAALYARLVRESNPASMSDLSSNLDTDTGRPNT